MKKLILQLVFCLAAVNAFAQPSFVGDWQGNLNAGGLVLRIVFHITQTPEGYKATMDSPDQGARDIPASTVNVTGSDIEIEVAAIKGKFKGKLADADNITGNLHQGQMTLPLNLSKGMGTSTVNKPQTPAPPYDYTVEEVSYANANNSITYGATITIPKGEGPFPAALLISGSGPQNRNAEIFEHKSFAVIADYLTKNGYMVLRVDDRGIGKTTGNFSTATTDDFVTDAAASFKYLQSRKEANPKKLGLIGHSEGGLIAEILASQNKDVNFAVLMAAPGVKTMQLMEEQNAALMEQKGLDKTTIDEYIKLYHNISVAAVNAKSEEQAKKDIIAVVKKWKNTVDPKTVQLTTGMGKEANDEIDTKVMSSFAQGFSGVWIRKFLSYDPAVYLQKTNAKVLALNGSKDVQVLPASNLAAINANMKKSPSSSYVTKELTGLNHLFQNCSKCTPAEYGELTETISPVALEIIKTWLDKEVK